ncbi:MAG: membrane-bound lytic murein transglycosylase MltF [bacterium]|nr:MAG: membrane-bound lytic murein transglycosylase MltF [bacterium]
MNGRARGTWVLSFLALIVLTLFLLVSAMTRTPDRDLEEIVESGRIVMITQNSANTYYIDRDEPSGFEYELAQEFADYLGVQLEVITPGWSRMIDFLNRGRGDFIAAGMTITPSREELVDFSDEYLRVQQMIVVNKDNLEVRSLEDLNGRTVKLREDTSYQERLMELRDEGLDVRLDLFRDVPTEEFIRMVAEGEIEITIADSNIAMLNRRYYPDVRIAFPVQEDEPLGWAVRKGSLELVEKINGFFEHIKGNGVYNQVLARHYGNLEAFEYHELKRFHGMIETRMPEYRNIIVREAEKHAIDWRLIAAVVYQESHFNPRAWSYTGVRGLMQVTKKTAEEMGISDRLDPEESIKAGVGYIAKLYSRFDEVEEDFERMTFALASYNVGYGHVRDAQRLARRQGLDPNRWSSLKKTLPLLRYPKYYRQTVFGYARGTEPVRFVERVRLYYDILRRKSAYEPA